MAPVRLTRVAVCEAAIDALSLAAIERSRRDTLYAATAGGMGPETIVALQQLLQVLSADPAGMLIAATDADAAGRRHAARLAALATEAGGAVRRDPAAGRAERLERRAARADAGVVTPDRVPPALLIDCVHAGKKRTGKSEQRK